MTKFQKIPASLCEQITAQVAALRASTSTGDQIRALFLCFELLKDAERKIGAAAIDPPSTNPSQ